MYMRLKESVSCYLTCPRSFKLYIAYWNCNEEVCVFESPYSTFIDMTRSPMFVSKDLVIHTHAHTHTQAVSQPPWPIDCDEIYDVIVLSRSTRIHRVH